MNGTRQKVIQQTIAVTWSPNPNMYKYITNPKKQLYEHFFSVLSALKLCAQYECYPEFHVNGNLHYHLIVQLFDKVKWYKKVLPTLKYHGFVYIKINVDEGWRIYCQKNEALTMKVLGVYLPIRHTDSLPEKVADYAHELALEKSHTIEFNDEMDTGID